MNHQPANNESAQPSRPLTNLQLELLKLYGRDLPDEDLQEVKQLLAQFFAQKSVAEADRVWDKRGLTNEDMDEWLSE